jgi:hypothetical protein
MRKVLSLAILLLVTDIGSLSAQSSHSHFNTATRASHACAADLSLLRESCAGYSLKYFRAISMPSSYIF